MKNAQFKLLIVLHVATLFLIGMLFIKFSTLNSTPSKAVSSSNSEAKTRKQSSEGIPLSTPSPSQNIDYSQNYIYGNKDAPNELVIFSNYTCGYCKQFYNQNFKTLNEEYIQTGKLKVVFIFNGSPMNKMGALMAKAAEIARSHSEYQLIQDSFYSENFELDSIHVVEQLKAIGVDDQEIKERLNSEELVHFIDDQLAIGRAHGVRGTPIFFLNNKKWEGYLGEDDFWVFFNENVQ